ncbi:hypothetical protein CHS0354_001084 [Potamilus streckersoni]|uniref:BTB domain-containing protein n=1 Tax=Potamilus streckersoni TaxID=2493646 RepID=A0AAE0VJD0_9BIVA|nr:hypothetical protein CHS0354_001084 [Potamilus streckersoni]
MPGFYPECGPKCRSRKHAQEFNAAISKCTLREIKAFSRLCYNAAQYSDSCGRSALHLAAACGKTDIAEWLLNEKNGDVTTKDTESGWTALHRALFYGQLAAVRLLVQNNSDLYTRDHEGLGPLDLIMKDQPPRISYSRADPSEIFTWGDNSNFTLGHSTENRRCGPEPVDEFRKLSISIRQVVMCKYHTVFLSTEGQVYTCGHGQGGRLCHGDEATCLVPKLVETIRNEKCRQVAAARDHTVMLMEGNIVYSCGLNDFHQLGQFPAPDKSLVPKQVYAKVFKGKAILGVCTGRFHTVIYTSDAVFTFGLNAGQLGHPKIKADRKISQPRQVSALNLKDLLIVSVCCSSAATVCLTGQGDIFVLHEYQCRKIASKWHEIKDIQVSGGHLDHSDSEILREKGGSELVIGLLSISGKVFIWRATNQTLRRAHWVIRRQLFVSGFKLTDTNLAIITEKGEAFLGLLSNKKNSLNKDAQHYSKEHSNNDFGMITLMDLLLKDEVEDVQVVRIASVNRGTYITADSKGRDFAVLQSLPNCSLTDVPMVCHSEMISNFRVLQEEADEFDTIHDVILQCKGHSWPAHRFILQSRSAYFNNLFQKDAYNEKETANVTLSDVHPQIFEQALLYMYTDSCELLNIGSKFEMKDTENEAEEMFHMDLDDLDSVLPVPDSSKSGKKISAFEVHQKKKTKNKDCQKENGKHNANFKSPVKMLQEVAKRFGIKGLSKKADCVRYSNGLIVSTGRQLQQPRLKFDKQRFRDSRLDVYDVSIQSSDGIIFPCHKCVLVARLEYFHSMLASGWMETSASAALTLPIPGEILEILLDYLYTDEAPLVTSCGNADLLCNILIVADQMLVFRLKEICEVALADLITIKNAAELLEFSCVYNASQLKATCQQFISLNLSTILEARALDVLSNEVLSDLTTYYRNSIPSMSSRIITPYNEGPDKAFLEFLADQDEDQSNTETSELSMPKKPKAKRKRQKSRSFSEEGEKGSLFIHSKTERHVSVSSDVSFKSDEDLTELMDSLSTSPIENIPSENVNTNAVHIPMELKVTPIKLCIGQTPKGPHCPINPTQAWSLKSPVFSMSAQTLKGSLCMRSPTGAVSFKDIMEEEEQHLSPEMKGTGSEKKTKFSWKDVKKHQQKEQKQQQQQKKQEQDIKKNTSSQQLSDQSVKSTCPWGAKNQIVQSFRNLMTEQQQISASSPVKQKTPAVSSSHLSPTAGAISWALPSTKVHVPKMDTKKSDKMSSAMARSPENPWQKSNHMAQSPPAISASSFSEIVKDEMELRDVLNKAKKKPFGLIQMEEQAIQELRDLYKASQDFDEYITVERVPQAAATPLWTDERKKAK